MSVVEGSDNAESFSLALAPLLSSSVLPDEYDLVTNTAKIVRITHGFSIKEQEALIRCITLMCSGMPGFQHNKSLRGLRSLDELRGYCYVVAGVVGYQLPVHVETGIRGRIPPNYRGGMPCIRLNNFGLEPSARIPKCSG